jgi:prolipoprotein diacylglyceryltransferase
MMISFDLVPLFLLVWSSPGIVGAIISAVIIRWAEPRVNTTSLATIAFGWIAGMIIGGIVGAIVLALAFSSNSSNTFSEVAFWIISWSITAMLSALIGSWITYKVLEPLTLSE